jgi:hypothetical protein
MVFLKGPVSKRGRWLYRYDDFSSEKRAEVEKSKLFCDRAGSRIQLQQNYRSGTLKLFKDSATMMMINGQWPH